MSLQTPQISIAMTSHNREAFLETAIQSILIQTEQDFELIVWDDGSTDKSAEIARCYSKWDERIKVIQSPHRGACFALNEALKLARGKYLGWVDSDDYLAPSCLEETKAVLDEKTDVGLVYTYHYEVDEQLKKAILGHKCIVPYMGRDTLLVAFMTFHFRLFRKEILQQIGGLDTNLQAAFDYDFCLKASEITDFYCLEKPLYYYRIHSNSISSKKRLQQSQCVAEARDNAIIRRGYV